MLDRSYIKEDYEVVQKNSGVYVVRDKRTGEEHPKVSLSEKDARALKKKLEAGGVSRRVNMGEDSAAGTPAVNAIGNGDGVAGLTGDPPKHSRRNRKLLKRSIPLT